MAKNLSNLFSQMSHEANTSDSPVNREKQIPVAISLGLIFEVKFSTFGIVTIRKFPKFRR